MCGFQRGSGLPGTADTQITIDCSKLLKDLQDRLSAGDSLADLMHDMHYGVLAEVEECLDRLLGLIQLKMEKTMVNTITVGRNTSPEPPKSLPFF